MIRANKILAGGVEARLMDRADAARMKDAFVRNQEHLAPWEPERPPEFFTVTGQHRIIETRLASYAAGIEVPWLIHDKDTVIGAITLTGIILGPFRSAHVGYWVDYEYTGCGIGFAALRHALDFARDGLGLHRVQAATLLHNAASQKILCRARFEKIGMAPAYLKIQGSWQDHNLYQRLLY